MMSRATFFLTVICAGFSASLAAEDMNRQVLYKSSFESGETSAPFGWQRAADEDVLVWSKEKAATGDRSLAIEDSDKDGYGEWDFDYVSIPEEAQAGNLVVEWKELYKISSGEMRLTLILFDAEENQVSARHFVTSGKSEGWEEGTFSKKIRKLMTPKDAAKLRLAMVSGGPPSTMGSYYIDDLEVAMEVDESAEVEGEGEEKKIVRPLESWDMEERHPRFEDRPAQWERTGSLPYLASWSEKYATSGGKSLAIVDDDTRSHGMWVTDRMPLEPAPDELQLSFDLKTIDLDGAWKVCVAYYKETTDINYSPLFYRVDGMITPSEDGINLTWIAVEDGGRKMLGERTYSGDDLAEDGFWRVTETIPVPVEALSYRFAFMSGWDSGNTGSAWLDSLELKRVD